MMATTTERTAGPVQQRSVATRQRLLDAAIDCLVDRGYSGTTTTIVCQRAGLSRGAQLHHFPTREDLVVSAIGYLARRRFADLAAQAETVRAAEDPVGAGVRLLWSLFSGPLFFAATELWLAARTDAGLHASLYPAERELGRDVHRLCRTVLPEQVTTAPWFDGALDTMGYLMRGLALSRVLKDDPDEVARVLDLCAGLLRGGRY
jgi:AcrR family transcriptional regulator